MPEFLEVEGNSVPWGEPVVCKLCTLVFFSIVRHASTQRRMPAPRGMANQHLRTFERGYLRGVYYFQVLYLHLMTSLKKWSRPILLSMKNRTSSCVLQGCHYGCTVVEELPAANMKINQNFCSTLSLFVSWIPRRQKHNRRRKRIISIIDNIVDVLFQDISETNSNYWWCYIYFI